MSYKPILCLDFDGVIHSYESGWKGAAVIPDPPVSGAIDFIKAALDVFEVAIFSSRSHQDGGLTAMQRWLDEFAGEELSSRCSWPLDKPSALVTIDDRAVQFTGEWPSLESLRQFKPWNKK